MKRKNASLSARSLSLLVLGFFLFSLFSSDLLRAKESHAMEKDMNRPAQILSLTEAYSLPMLKGLQIDPKKPLEINFIIDSADKAELKDEDVRSLVSYFLVALTVPEKDLWVNLSPYEKDRILPESLVQTDLGKEMLAQDYVLKQLSASLTFPNTDLGEKYWQVKDELKDDSENFSKIWIIPDVADVYEDKGTVVITDSSLKVMSEQDYLAKQKQKKSVAVDQVLLPEISKEVNEGRHFSKLRQFYSALILATWFKEKVKDSFYRHYIDKNKTKEQELPDAKHKEEIYQKYLNSVKNGVYEIVKKEKLDSKKIKRKYFSGGNDWTALSSSLRNVASSTILNESPQDRFSAHRILLEAQGSVKDLPMLTQKQEEESVSWPKFPRFETAKNLTTYWKNFSHAIRIRLDDKNISAAVDNYYSEKMMLGSYLSGELNEEFAGYLEWLEYLESRLKTHEHLDSYAEYEGLKDEFVKAKKQMKKWQEWLTYRGWELNERKVLNEETLRKLENNLPLNSHEAVDYLMYKSFWNEDQKKFTDLFYDFQAMVSKINILIADLASIEKQILRELERRSRPMTEEEQAYDVLDEVFVDVYESFVSVKARIEINQDRDDIPAVFARLVEGQQYFDAMVANVRSLLTHENEIVKLLARSLIQAQRDYNDFDFPNLQFELDGRIELNEMITKKDISRGKKDLEEIVVLFDDILEKITLLKSIIEQIDGKSYGEIIESLPLTTDLFEGKVKKIIDLKKYKKQSPNVIAMVGKKNIVSDEEGFGFVDFSEEQKNFAYSIAEQLALKGIHEDDVFALARSIATLKRGSVKERKVFFNVAKQLELRKKSMDSAMVETFVNGYKMELNKYLASEEFTPEEITLLLKKRLIPYRWYEILRKNMDHDDTVIMLKTYDNPIGVWQATYARTVTRAGLPGNNISAQKATDLILKVFEYSFINYLPDLVRLFAAIEEHHELEEEKNKTKRDIAVDIFFSYQGNNDKQVLVDFVDTFIENMKKYDTDLEALIETKREMLSSALVPHETIDVGDGILLEFKPKLTIENRWYYRILDQKQNILGHLSYLKTEKSYTIYSLYTEPEVDKKVVEGILLRFVADCQIKGRILSIEVQDLKVLDVLAQIAEFDNAVVEYGYTDQGHDYRSKFYFEGKAKDLHAAKALMEKEKKHIRASIRINALKTAASTIEQDKKAHKELYTIFNSALENLYTATAMFNQSQEKLDDDLELEAIQYAAQTSDVLIDNLRRKAATTNKLERLFLETVRDSIHNYDPITKELVSVDKTFDIMNNIGVLQIWDEMYEDDRTFGKKLLSKIQARLDRSVFYVLASIVDILDYFDEDSYSRIKEAGLIKSDRDGPRERDVIDMPKAIEYIHLANKEKKKKMGKKTSGGMDFESLKVSSSGIGLPLEIEGIDFANLAGLSFRLDGSEKITNLKSYLNI